MTNDIRRDDRVGKEKERERNKMKPQVKPGECER